MKYLFTPLLYTLFVARLFAQCPTVPICPPDSTVYADLTSNEPWFWNSAPFTWDSLHQQSDLTDAPLPLVCIWPDTCGMGNLEVDFHLLLDLNSDGVQETRISSTDILPEGNFVFNNLFGGTDTLKYDNRPGFLRYHFEVLTEHVGDSLQFSLVWVSSMDTVPAQLPLGDHQLLWLITEGGDTDSCGYSFVVRDTTPPLLVCGPQINGNIPVSGKLTLWASDFLQTVNDNLTPSGLIQIAIRKKNTNETGFPLNPMGNPITKVEFACNEAGLTPVEHWVELWARDKAGNTTFCEVKVTVGLAVWDCNIHFTLLRICPHTEGGELIGNVKHEVDGANSFIGNFHYVRLQENPGCAIFHGDVPLYSDISISSTRNDNILNGVTTYDLVLISKHILGLQPLTSRYKMIAADANRSGSITTFDILTLRKLILGIDTALTSNTSWIFIPDSYVFPDTLNPFSPPFSTVEYIEDWIDSPDWRSTTGVKVGDVNGSAIPELNGTPVAEGRDLRMLSVGNTRVLSDNSFDYPVYITQNETTNGFQLSLQYDPELVEINAVESDQLPDFGAFNWSVPRVGELRISWSAGEAATVRRSEPLFRIKGRTLTEEMPGYWFNQVTSASWPSEMYDAAGNVYSLQLGEDAQRLEQMAVYAARPNPCTDVAVVPLELEEGAWLELALWDTQGRKLWNHAQFYEKGAHLLEIPSHLFPDSGCYYWRLNSGQHSVSGILVKE
ncbi:MAG: hypothetical protein J0M29_10190 [Chitinophagales bacterium]|nr:hypothetical protein [Chitinophagales bacterium]